MTDPSGPERVGGADVAPPAPRRGVASAYRVHALQECMRQAPHLSMAQAAWIVDQAADLLQVGWREPAREVLRIVLDAEGTATVLAALHGPPEGQP